MAKFKQETRHILGMKVVLNYMIDNQEGYFYLNTPDQLCKLGARGRLRADTFNDLCKEVDQMIADLEESVTTTKKVILYKVTLFGVQPEDIGIGTRFGKEWKEFEQKFTDWSYRSDGVGMIISYHIKYVRVVKDSHWEAIYGQDNGSISLYSDTEDFKTSSRSNSLSMHEQMDWCQEAEDFFEMVSKAQKDMILKVHNFFNVDNDKLIHNIVNNKFLT